MGNPMFSNINENVNDNVYRKSNCAKEIILFGKDIYESYKDLSNDQKTTLNMFIDFEKFIYEQ